MKIRILGAHKLESLDTRHTCFLVDGILGVDAGSLASALTAAEQAKVKAILLTHRHFDHTRDLPTLGLGTLELPHSVDLYSLSKTLEAVRRHLLNGDIYPDLTQQITEAPPKYRLNPIQVGVPFKALDYQVKPLPVSHPAPSVGYIIQSKNGACFAYTGDTSSSLLPFFQDSLKPQVMFVEVTFPNQRHDLAKLTGHLTPAMLRDYVIEGLEAGLPIPQLIAVHRSPEYEEELVEQLAEVAQQLNIDLLPAKQDTEMELRPSQDTSTA